MSQVLPWQTSNIPGPKQANLLQDSKVVISLAKRKRTLLVVGHEVLGIKVGNTALTDLLANMGGINNVATVDAIKVFQNAKNVVSMPAIDIINRLKDPNWKGIDGAGAYEVVLTLGITYYFQSQLLSTLKHFAPNVLTISLDRFYQPNADFSFPNLSEEKWNSQIVEILNGLKGY